MELFASGAQQKQAEEVNKKQEKNTNYKKVLEKGDIGVVRVEKNTCGATDFPWLPVMVTDLLLNDRNRVMYKLCSTHAYLKGKFDREMIHHKDGMLADILKFDPENSNMLHDLTVAQASQKYNQLGGKSFCRCKRNCVLNKKQCSCIALGILCRDKCHGIKKGCNPVHCSNYAMPGALPQAAPVDYERKRHETSL